MLEGIRNKRNSVIVLAVFAAIIIVFIFWGVGPQGDGSGDQGVVATVDGVPITTKEYMGLYRRQVDYFRETFKGQFTDEMAEKLNLKQRALDSLIGRALALKEAKNRGIKADEKEVQSVIGSMPAFQANGKFDKEQYLKTLASNRLKPAEFEKSIEADIITSKVREEVVKGITVTDDEAKKAFMDEFRKLNLVYATIDPAAFAKDVKVTDDEAKAYLQKNGSAFMVPAKIKVFYAFADFEKTARKLSMADADIKEYYEKNKMEFQTPPAIKARHILIRPDAKAKDMAKAKGLAKKKAEETLARIKAGEDFAKLAAKLSEDPGSARQGGDLGWFGRGAMVRQFEDAAFSLKKGEVSPVVETEFGYHIIKADDVRDAGYAPITEVKARIAEALSREKAYSEAKQKIQGFSAAIATINSPDELKKAAAKAGLDYNLSGLITADKMDFFGDAILKDTVMSLKAGEATRPIETQEGIYLVKAVERIDAHVPPYAEVAPAVKKLIMAEKSSEEAKKKAASILAGAKDSASFDAAVKKEKLKTGSTGAFRKGQGNIPAINAPITDAAKLFALTQKAPVYAEAVQSNGKYHILRLKDIEEADMALFEPLKPAFTRRLLGEKQEKAINDWLSELEKNAKINVYQERM